MRSRIRDACRQTEIQDPSWTINPSAPQEITMGGKGQLHSP